MQPNILFINLDQQRYDSLACTGNPIVKTPHIDQLAAEGILFNSAFTPIPLCCPARQTLLSGQMPDHHGGLWNYDICSPIPGLSPDLETWPKSLTAAGYDCAYLGKWHVHSELDATHFGYRSHRESLPIFDETKLIRQYPIKDPGLSIGVGLMEDVPADEAHTHRLAKLAVTELEGFASQERPWHLRVDFFEPHLPCYCAREFASLYRPEKIPPWPNFAEGFDNKPYIQRKQVENWGLQTWTWEEWSIYLAAYYGMVSQVDDAVGIILKRLAELGMEENTIVVFTTDHGDAAGSHRMMDKHYVMYEEEVRVPLIIRWPGTVERGTQCDDFTVHFLDLPPTLLEAAGLQIPETFQGRSLLPVLKGKPNPDPRPFIFSTYNGQQFGLYTQRMIRDRRFKFIWNATDLDEFYDLKTDPDELHNLATEEKHAETLNRYRKQLGQCFSDLGDPMIKGNPWMEKELNLEEG